jgi:hypothetical protein
MATFQGVSSANNGRVNSAFVPQHSHSESSLHWMVEKIAGIVFDFSKAIDYATQWIDYSKCSDEVKGNAGKVKSALNRANSVFAGLATGVAAHDLLGAKSPGIAEVTGFVSSTAEFIDRLDVLGAINLREGASPVIAGIGVASDVLGGLYDSAGVLNDDHIKNSDSRGLARAKQSALYKFVKIAENVAFVALAALSGYATYCAVFAVAVPAILPFTLLAVGTAALSIKMMRCFYEGLADDGQAQNLAESARNRRRPNHACDASIVTERARQLEAENAWLKSQVIELNGVIQGLREALNIGVSSFLQSIGVRSDSDSQQRNAFVPNNRLGPENGD